MVSAILSARIKIITNGTIKDERTLCNTCEALAHCLRGDGWEIYTVENDVSSSDTIYQAEDRENERAFSAVDNRKNKSRFSFTPEPCGTQVLVGRWDMENIPSCSAANGNFLSRINLKRDILKDKRLRAAIKFNQPRKDKKNL